MQVSFDGFTLDGTDKTPALIHIIPNSVSVHFNGYRTAATFEMEFDSRLLPISPEIIRSAGVEIYIFQTQGFIDDQSLILRDGVPSIAGLVDDIEVNLTEDGGTVRITGRDYTGLLTDLQWPGVQRNLDGTPKKGADGFGIPFPSKFPGNLPLDQAVQSVVDRVLKNGPNHTFTLNVKWIGEGDIASVDTIGATTLKKKGVSIKPTTNAVSSRTAQRGGLPQPSGRSYWDVIFSVCQQLGYICYIQGTDLIISRPQVLFADAKNTTYAVAYGQNLESLSITRHLGKLQVPQIKAFSYNPDTGEQISAVFPKDPPKKVSGLGTVKESVRFINMLGVKDVATLAANAEKYYNQISRDEAKIHFSTSDLKDLAGLDLVPSLTNGTVSAGLRPGLPVHIDFDAVNRTQLQQFKSQGERYQKLIALGFSGDVARLISVEFDNIKQFQAPFYLKDWTINFSIDDGISLEGTGIAYVSVARDGDG